MERSIKLSVKDIVVGGIIVAVCLAGFISGFEFGMWQQKKPKIEYLYTTLHFNATFLGYDGNFTFRLNFLNGTDTTIKFVGVNQANSPNYFAEGDSWFSGLSVSVKSGDNLTITFLRPPTIRNDVKVSLFYQNQGVYEETARWIDFVWKYPYNETISMEVWNPLKGGI